MARLGRRAKRAKAVDTGKADAQAGAGAKPAGQRGLPLPSPMAATNLAIADIVLRAAGGLLRNRMEKGLLVKSYDKAKAEQLVDGRSVATSVALWGASRIATRSPLGLAVVAGGLAAKVFYDRGKRLEARRKARKAAKPPATSES